MTARISSGRRVLIPVVQWARFRVGRTGKVCPCGMCVLSGQDPPLPVAYFFPFTMGLCEAHAIAAPFFFPGAAMYVDLDGPVYIDASNARRVGP